MTIPDKLLKRHLTPLHPSIMLLASVLAVHVLALLAVSITALPTVVKAGLLMLVFTHSIYSGYRWYKTPLYRLCYGENTGFTIISNTGGESACLQVVACYYWSRWLLILRVENHKGRRYYLPLCWDCCDRKSFHALRLLAKYFLASPE
ncbi:MAG: hypothetical protein KTR20_09380 [Cellvibrionaceae bacterium]|nr:hypothetical protein [Cellvibrionaceae bacterium]